MKVTVRQGVQVNYDGTNYTGGQTVDVPDQVAAFWIRSEWVTEAPKSRQGAISNATLPKSRRREP
jgi:hypothetical protein